MLQNTFILRRRWPPPLHKKGGKVPKMKGRHFVYDLVEDTSVKKKPDIRIVLNQFVEGLFFKIYDTNNFIILLSFYLAPIAMGICQV